MYVVLVFSRYSALDCTQTRVIRRKVKTGAYLPKRRWCRRRGTADRLARWVSASVNLSSSGTLLQLHFLTHSMHSRGPMEDVWGYNFGAHTIVPDCLNAITISLKSRATHDFSRYWQENARVPRDLFRFTTLLMITQSICTVSWRNPSSRFITLLTNIRAVSRRMISCSSFPQRRHDYPRTIYEVISMTTYEYPRGVETVILWTVCLLQHNNTNIRVASRRNTGRCFNNDYLSAASRRIYNITPGRSILTMTRAFARRRADLHRELRELRDKRESHAPSFGLIQIERLLTRHSWRQPPNGPGDRTRNPRRRTSAARVIAVTSVRVHIPRLVFRAVPRRNVARSIPTHSRPENLSPPNRHGEHRRLIAQRRVQAGPALFIVRATNEERARRRRGRPPEALGRAKPSEHEGERKGARAVFMSRVLEGASASAAKRTLKVSLGAAWTVCGARMRLVPRPTPRSYVCV